MIALILAIGVATFSSLFLSPLLIKWLENHEMGQFIRQDGPKTHLIKRGTPTMGGVVVIFSSILGYLCAAAWMYLKNGRMPKISSLLIFALMFAMGAIGFFDDWMKISKKQNLGLSAGKKLILQLIVSTLFAVAAISLPNSDGRSPASLTISFTRNLNFDNFKIPIIIAVILTLIWINLIIASWTNAINLTDGLDGLAVGISMFIFAGYIIITFWQFHHDCFLPHPAYELCYLVRDPWDLALVSGAITGSCFGFLWWNANPAKIFMGDTGSLALGGALAGLTILTQTELLALIIGGVLVCELLSVVLQVGVFKWKHKRIFKMAPIHHHFEMLGWKEVNVVIRFWMMSAVLTAIGVGIFYGSWLIGLAI